MNFKDLSRKLKNGDTTSVNIVKSLISRVEQINPQIGAFIDIDKDDLMRQAEESDTRRNGNSLLSEYDGIPVAIKDNILIEGQVVECASKILSGFKAPYSATVINKLKAMGFLTYGRLNMDEFAMGSSTENSALQLTRNPYDVERTPGGSSGGSAAAVASGMAVAALGSDTGGSVRQPASFCSVVGLKPTYGTVSRYGLVAFASSLDQVGPLTSCIDDSQILYEAMAGRDKNDSTSVELQSLPEKPIEKLVIGIDPSLVEQCDASTKKSFERVLNVVRGRCSVKEISLPNQKYANQVYYITATSEASANLARFDGVRYGSRSNNAENLVDLYEKSRSEGFGEEVKRRILLGTFALSSGYYDAFYGKAQKVRRLIQEDYLQAFKEVDAIVLPVSPSAAFKIAEKTKNPVEMYLSDLFTVGASLAGIPAISVPGPFEELPIGIQIQGPFFSEKRLFSIGRLIESEFVKTNPVAFS